MSSAERVQDLWERSEASTRSARFALFSRPASDSQPATQTLDDVKIKHGFGGLRRSPEQGRPPAEMPRRKSR
jgi:hypothetical protein